jgi:hypothetical protein
MQESKGQHVQVEKNIQTERDLAGSERLVIYEIQNTELKIILLRPKTFLQPYFYGQISA